MTKREYTIQNLYSDENQLLSRLEDAFHDINIANSLAHLYFQKSPLNEHEKTCLSFLLERVSNAELILNNLVSVHTARFERLFQEISTKRND